MAISYPTSKDALTNPVGTDLFTAIGHAEQHATASKWQVLAGGTGYVWIEYMIEP